METAKLSIAHPSSAVSKPPHARSIFVASTAAEFEASPQQEGFRTGVQHCEVSPLKDASKRENGGRKRMQQSAKNNKIQEATLRKSTVSFIQAKQTPSFIISDPLLTNYPGINKKESIDTSEPRFQLSLVAALGFDTSTPPLYALRPTDKTSNASTGAAHLTAANHVSPSQGFSKKMLCRSPDAPLVKVALGAIATGNTKTSSPQRDSNRHTITQWTTAFQPNTKHSHSSSHNMSETQTKQPPTETSPVPFIARQSAASQIPCDSSGEAYILSGRTTLPTREETKPAGSTSLSSFPVEPVVQFCKTWSFIPHSMAAAFACITEAQLRAAIESVHEYHD